jgi:hypothetical protein
MMSAKRITHAFDVQKQLCVNICQEVKHEVMLHSNSHDSHLNSV